MRAKWLAAVATGLAVPVAFVWFWLTFGDGRTGVVIRDVQLLSRESDVLHAGDRATTGTEVLRSGDSLVVLWDTYGKDYWACYVRTPSGARGWVNCGALSPMSDD